MVNRILAVIRREYLERVKTKAFWISTILVPIFLGAVMILSGSIDRAVTVRGLGVTKGARAAIEAAGGKVEIEFALRAADGAGGRPAPLPASACPESRKRLSG